MWLLDEETRTTSKRRYSCITTHYLSQGRDCGSLLMGGEGGHQLFILIWLCELLGGRGKKMTLSLVLQMVACYATIANTVGN